MESIFRPGLAFLNRFTFKKKFLIIFIFIGIPISGLFISYIQQLNKEINFSKGEQIGLTYVNTVSMLMKNTQQHRGLSVGFLNGEKTLEGDLAKKQAEINNIYQQLEVLITNSNDTLSVKNDYDRILVRWQELSNGLYTLTSTKSFQEHTDLINIQLDLLGEITDASRLSTDNDLVNNLLIALVTDKLPRVTEYLGEARAIGTGIASKKFKSDEDQLQLLFSKQSVEIYRHDARRILQSIFTFKEKQLIDLKTQSENLIDEVEKIGAFIDDNFIMSSNIEINAQDYFEAVTTSIDEVYSFIDFATSVLEKRLDERIGDLQFARNSGILLTAVTGTISIYLFLAFYVGVQNNISIIKSATEKIAEGDLTEKITIISKDEFQQISESVNVMVQSFNKIVASNQRVAEEVALSTNDLAMVTEETAKATEQITLSMEDVSRIVEMQLSNAKESQNTLQDLSQSLFTISSASNIVAASSQFMSTQAQKGNGTVEKTIEQMAMIKTAVSNTEAIIDRLNLRSANISNIVTMITTIADQTNLLALNAAIEAARAGDAGKGFAVVAAEVRKLAENSSVSANNIQKLIDETLTDTKLAIEAMKNVSEETDAGIGDVEDTKETFQTIYQSTMQVVTGIDDVANLSREMTGKLHQLTEALSSVSTLSIQVEGNTQQVAAATEEQLASMEEISSTVANLNEKAIMLEQQIDRFKV
ncbi:methyl-accepting chemotaxis protein [Anaerobacillus isosaccharinicus]|uniref:HAMP domain-containing protein n=1 Tax=Anaerobacillus isosaccharinicus TaxID=1532552 RepID=A0A1S2LAD8_9BACI|nr:methyl-accepting chemotaxis protein [Anaerobacillus isosaccharinicus]MBA5588667.1 HAMP domain-containing protein [Anaerobacillus isosaccharinicus]QOY37927.1 HAMP domain-containing protein [Anaerobacillus isosaccharinicus]